jgi:predicted MPP superfamily phosphohydrolase
MLDSILAIRISQVLKRHGVKLGLGLGGLAIAGTGLYLYANKIEPRAYRLERLRLRVGRASVNGAEPHSLKILHISDLHLCEPETHKIAFLQSLADEEFDLVFLTGDIFQNHTGLQYATQILKRMPRLGAYAVLGNHDYYAYNMVNKTIGRVFRRFRTPKTRRDVQPWVEALELVGFQVLRDESRHLERQSVSIIGIDYPWTTAAKLKSLVRSAPEENLLVALFHLPKKLDMIADCGIDVAFGGHTHGGQIRIPGMGAIITDSELKAKESAGVVRKGNTVFHISRGLGADPRSNIRMFCPPAATVIELQYQV